MSEPSSNPPPASPPISYQSPPAGAAPKPSGRAAYNIVTDTVGGPNIRLKDNLLQLFCCIGGAVLGLIMGFIIGLMSRDMALPVIAGAFIGLLAGLFGSGIYLMIFRAARHARGKHD